MRPLTSGALGLALLLLLAPAAQAALPRHSQSERAQRGRTGAAAAGGERRRVCASARLRRVAFAYGQEADLNTPAAEPCRPPATAPTAPCAGQRAPATRHARRVPHAREQLAHTPLPTHSTQTQASAAACWSAAAGGGAGAGCCYDPCPAPLHAGSTRPSQHPTGAGRRLLGGGGNWGGGNTEEIEAINDAKVCVCWCVWCVTAVWDCGVCLGVRKCAEHVICRWM